MDSNLRDLDVCFQVMVRTDATRKPLKPPYGVPYKAIKLEEHSSRLYVGGKSKTASLDQL